MHNNKELFDWINNNFHYPIKTNVDRDTFTIEKIYVSPEKWVSCKYENFRNRRRIKFYETHGKFAFIQGCGSSSWCFPEILGVTRFSNFLIFSRHCSFVGLPCAITSPVNRDSLTIYLAGKKSHASVRRITHETTVWQGFIIEAFFEFYLFRRNKASSLWRKYIHLNGKEN